MKMKFENFELSGKGISVSGEYMENNLKLVFENTEFLEVVLDDGTRMGWYVNGEFMLMTDFTVHTKRGMNGESFQYPIKLPFLRDNDRIISQLTNGQLQDMNTKIAELAFKKMFRSSFDHFKGDFNLDPDRDALVIISTVSEVIHVQSEEESIHVSGKGIYVLKLDEEKLSIVSQRDGITVVNDDGKTVRIGGPKGIEIDGLDINFGDIAREIKNSVREAFMDLDF